ncbi:alpha/beta fold hydrolase [Thermoactinomyces mirandus]|uniref:Alpha/beta hydrolase n=1 Tax=Thermoactinomyces mirandus TaxID=2756294 RepID=A0A7W1XPV4_9BACL|nr:alpha/beta hydrolase [Thermoactinomyces mirandus]MBA4601092.1 alpha/beta hydrolase [Thermoactinomyces mirandus]
MFRSQTPNKQLEKGTASIETIKLGGIRQTIMIRSRSNHHPILLFLHGGPGLAHIGFMRHYQAELEKHFIVVHWDQRGAGKSFSAKIDPDTMTLEQLVSDTHDLIQFLLKRYKQKKVYLAAHSWGSIIGALFAKKHPSLLHAYIGIGQMTDAEKSELLSYQFLLIHARNNRNFWAVRALNRIGYPPYQRICNLHVQRRWLSRFSGDIRNGSLCRYLAKGFISSEYTLADWFRWCRGCRFSFNHLMTQLMKVNLFEEIDELKVPVYFCTGRYDFLSPFELQERLLQKIKAPVKDIIWFENSAHYPYLEENSAFLVALLRIKEESLLYQQKSIQIQQQLKDVAVT